MHRSFIIPFSLISLLAVEPSRYASALPAAKPLLRCLDTEKDYRSVRSGAWSNDSTWARYEAGVWRSPAPAPDTGSGVVTIRAGHTVTIKAPLVYDQVVVEEGAQVVVAPGIAHTLSDGPGNDLFICGTWVNQGSTWTVTGSARWVVNDGGTFVQNTSSGISTPLSKSVLSAASTFIYRGGAALTPSVSFSGRTFGNLVIDTSGGSWTCNATGSGTLTINGDLTIGAGVKWATSGLSGALLIKSATMIAGEWTGSGSGNQGMHTFAGRFTVRETGKYSLATSGVSQGSLTFQSDVTNHGALVTPLNRTILFNGQNAQVIAGATPITFYNGFTIDNPAGIQLDSPVFVHDTLKCLAGTIRAASQILTLDSTGVLVEGETSYVSGRISTAREIHSGLNETFGNLGFEITPLSSFSGSMVVTRVTDNALNLRRARAISRFFDIAHSLPSGGPIRMKFRFNDRELQGANKNKLSLFRSTDGGNSWTNEGGTIDPAGNVIMLEGGVSASRWAAAEPIPIPTITGVTPAFSEIGSSLSLSIAGTGFLPGLTAVAFSSPGITVRSVSVNSSKQLSAWIDISATTTPGFCSVSVSNDSGAASSLVSGFEVRIRPNPFPTITAIIPASGVRGTVADVVIRGHGFVSGLTTVCFIGGITVQNVRVLSDTALMASLVSNRACVPGSYAVSVSNPPPGGGVCVLANGFAVLNPVPVVQSVSPTRLARGESTWIALQGGELWSDVSHLDAGSEIGIDSLVVESQTSLKARMIVGVAAEPGSRGLRVFNSPPGGGSASLAGAFMIVNPPPLVRKLTPDSLIIGENGEVMIGGSGFIHGATSVSLGNGISVDSVVVLSFSSLRLHIHAMCNAVAGPRDVIISNGLPGGGSSKLTGQFIVKSPRPWLASLTPGCVVGGESASIQLLGSGFVPGLTRLAFGSGISVDSLEFAGSSRIVASISVSGSMAGGARDVTLMNPGPGGGTALLLGGLVVNNPIPSVTSFSATSGCRGTTSTLIIKGRNFIQGITTLSFGEGIVVDTIRITAPDCLFAGLAIARTAATGAREVRVLNSGPGGGAQSYRGAFEVRNPLPSLLEIRPNMLCVGESASVKLLGSGFIEGVTTVNFGSGIEVKATSIDSAGMQLLSVVSVDSNAVAGDRTVRISNTGPGGGSATAAAIFQVINPIPVVTAISPPGGNRRQTLIVTVSGKNFVPGTTHLSLGPDLTIHNQMVSNTRTLSCTVDIGAEAALGQRNVVVSNPSPGGGVSALTNAFTIANSAPMLARVSPSSGAKGAIVEITLEGMNFTRGETSVSFGEGIAVNSSAIQSEYIMLSQVIISPGAIVGQRDIVLSTREPGGGMCRLVRAFTVVNPLPTIGSVHPLAGIRGKALSVSVSGSNFEPGVTSADFGPGVCVSGLRIPSPTALEADILIDDEARTGTRSVTVNNKGPGGGTVTLSGAFAIWNPAPELATVSPAECVRGRSVRVTLTGGNFTADETTVDFGAGIVVDSIGVTSCSEIVVRLHAESTADPGPRIVRVLNAQPGGGEAILANAFFVMQEIPSDVASGFNQVPPRFGVREAFPNPFNSRTAVSYQLSAVSLVKLSVFDLLGREVACLVNREQAAGVYQTTIDAHDMTSGIYVVRLEAETPGTHSLYIQSTKILLVK